tara:strand:+ start:186 stop:1163 length:978 start_codon:yes stop_codon:yes gene_type:complete
MGLKKIKLQNKEYNLSILDLLRILDPSKTGKFMNLLLKELKSIPENEVGEEYEESVDLYLDGMNGLNKILVSYLIELVGGVEVIRCMNQFINLSDKSLISRNDIQDYNSLGDLCNEVYKTELELANKSIESHQEVIFDNDKYLVLKPLNIISSRKYGASTKWCTSSSNPETFYSYSKKGVLLYIICRKNNDKWAVYYELDSRELSWWDVKDNRVDGLMVDLPKSLTKQIIKYILNEKQSNSYYFNEETKELLNKPTNEMVLPNTEGPGRFANPIPFNGVWPTTVNTTPWTPTSTDRDERIDELVTKTLEYHYTINALKKGGEEIN